MKYLCLAISSLMAISGIMVGNCLGYFIKNHQVKYKDYKSHADFVIEKADLDFSRGHKEDYTKQMVGLSFLQKSFVLTGDKRINIKKEEYKSTQRDLILKMYSSHSHDEGDKKFTILLDFIYNMEK